MNTRHGTIELNLSEFELQSRELEPTGCEFLSFFGFWVVRKDELNDLI